MGWLIDIPKTTKRISAAAFRKMLEKDPSVSTVTQKKQGYPDMEAWLLGHIEDEGLPAPIREYKFHDTRRWRFDMAWPRLKIAAEVEGGTFAKRFKGRHTTGEGFHKDCEKYNTAALMGWRVFRFDSPMVKNGQAVEVLKKALVEPQE